MLKPAFSPNDRRAKTVIWLFSFIVFLIVVSLKYIKLDVDLPFDPHLFATVNAGINATLAALLVAALIAVKKKSYQLHKNIMLYSMVLSFFFLISYIAHHMLTGDTAYPAEAPMRGFYFFILITHVILAAVILPFILFAVYRGLTGSYDQHKNIARITWPIWFYVAISGVIVYWFISPYYT